MGEQLTYSGESEASQEGLGEQEFNNLKQEVGYLSQEQREELINQLNDPLAGEDHRFASHNRPDN